MFAKLRALFLVCGIAAVFSLGCSNDNTSADMNGDAKCAKTADGKCAKTGEACTAKDGKCCGSCGGAKKE